MQGQTYDKLWIRVEEAQKKSLPKSAIKLAEQIFKKAEAEKNSPQMLKAYTARSAYQSQLTPDSFYVDLKGLEQWVRTTKNDVEGAILHTIIAGIYSDYAVNNQWQLRQRTDITEDAPDDIREWSANLFIKKVLDHTRAALGDATLLLATSSKDYRPFVIQGNTSEYYRHDMYHLLALKGVENLKKLDWLDQSAQTKSAVEDIFNRLTSTYAKRNNKSAFILASLDKLKYDYQSNRDEYLLALDKLLEGNSDVPVSTEIYLEKTSILRSRSEYVKALATADEAIAKFPDYERINTLKREREQILEGTIHISGNEILYPGSDYKLSITHRNLSNFLVEIFKVNLSVESPLVKYNDYKKLKSYLTKVSTQTVPLAKFPEYLQQDTVVTITTPQQEGLYLVRVSPAAGSKRKSEQLISVTRFNILTAKLPDNKFEVVVVDGMTGHPVQDADVCLYTIEKGDWLLAETLTTGADGRAITAVKDKRFQQITVRKGNDKSMMLQYINDGYYVAPTDKSVEKPSPGVKLLTDRSLYRPGQTVYVKGIAYNLLSDTANVIANQTYNLRLQDSNGREIGKKEIRTNEYGSFSTEFALPVGGLNGMYILSTEKGSIRIRVEEYKRPTFDITFAPLEGSYRVGDNVRVKGNVKSYSGVSVQDATVNYTIKRSRRDWWRGYITGDGLIGSGTVAVDDNGDFSIAASLQPDEQIEGKQLDGFYNYVIEATVTNVAGETQSSTTTIAAGLRSLLLDITVEDKVNKEEPIKITFAATNLSGRPVNVEGAYKLYDITDYKEKKTAKDPVLTGSFTSNKETTMPHFNSLPSGAYKLVIAAKDLAGHEATAEKELILFSPKDTHPPVETDLWYYPINLKFDEKTPASFVFGTSHEDTYVMMDVFSVSGKVESKSFILTDALMRFDIPFLQKYGDGILISFCFVKNGNVFIQQVRIEKTMPDKELKMKWEVFRDKLRPGQKEEWRLTIKDSQGMPAEAEMLATLYDASLDKIWKSSPSLMLNYRRLLPRVSWITYHHRTNYFSFVVNGKSWKYPPSLQYDNFWAPWEKIQFVSGSEVAVGGGSRLVRASAGSQMVKQYLKVAPQSLEAASQDEQDDLAENDILEPNPEELRTNFSETAFFYPQLRTNEKGEIVISFTMPESLTRWNFNGYAHTKGMLTGMLKGEVVTSKEFMLTPNLPRFVRIGDKTSVAASVTNTTGKTVSGTVTFTLFDPITEKVISVMKEKFTTAAGKSAGVNFTFPVTDKYDMLGCRIIADGGDFSDGEQHLLPVLSNKERMIETVSMPMRGNEIREFSLESLFNNNSKTATDRKLTVEYSGNPAWYAIQTLPSISTPTNDNAISWATAYYANRLAAYIMNAQPRIKTMFDAWKAQGGDKETFISNLQKNQDVKNILLEESPWLMEANSEADQMRRIATLFDLNNVSNNNITALNKLKELQLNNGSWTWYKGMNGSLYITNYILETLIRLNLLTTQKPDNDIVAMQRLAFNYLHKEALEEYQRIREAEKKGSKITGISGSALKYLYLIAIGGEKVPDTNTQAYNYFMGKVNESLSSQSVKEKAMSAIILSKAGKNAGGFMASLKEHLVTTDELGMYFAFNESPYRWNDLRIPIHVAVMEAFDVVSNDAKTVEEMKIWLLKQKQTQQWDSPVSTANAVYALMHRGANLLENRGNVRITIGNKVLETLSLAQENIPGTGYIKQSFTDKNMVSKPGKAKVEKRDNGIAWGAVYAQYNEDIDKVNRHAGELGVDKKLYVETIKGSGKQLVPITADTQLAVGDKVVSRITITLDRAMDFVQLKDQRGACFEPIGALSGYSWNNGFGCYVAVKDASTNFFFDSLGKGVYVLEHSYRVSRTGTYESGLAIIQSAYAPEYASHSASVKIEIK